MYRVDIRKPERSMLDRSGRKVTATTRPDGGQGPSTCTYGRTSASCGADAIVRVRPFNRARSLESHGKKKFIEPTVPFHQRRRLV